MAYTLALMLLSVESTGCKSVVRENILSSVNTGIGVTLAENPQTQLYEVKVGYIRSQFYSIPTSKTILKEDSAQDVKIEEKSGRAITGKSQYSPLTQVGADKTPELVSGVHVNSSAQHLLLGVDISESFAVGPLAVMSPAAVAMYVAAAKSPAAANAASEASKSVGASSAQYQTAASAAAAKSDERIDKIVGYAEDPLNLGHLSVSKVNTLLKNTDLADQAQKIAAMTPPEFKEHLQHGLNAYVGTLYTNMQ